MRYLKSYKIFESFEDLDAEDVKNIFFSCYEDMFDRLGETDDTTDPRMEFMGKGNELSGRVQNNTFYISIKDCYIADSSTGKNEPVIEILVYTNGHWQPFDIKPFEERIKPHKLHVGESRPMVLVYKVNGLGGFVTALVREHRFIIK